MPTGPYAFEGVDASKLHEVHQTFTGFLFGGLDQNPRWTQSVTGGIATVENLDAVSDSGFLQGLYVLPGWLGLTFLQATQGILRVAVGAVELLPAIVLFPFPDTDLSEDFNVFRQGDALVDVRNPLADNPAWLPYVLPITPITIDVRIAPVSPWAIYETPEDETASGSPGAWAIAQ